MNAGVGVNEDALGGEALGTVAGNGIAVVEMRVLSTHNVTRLPLWVDNCRKSRFHSSSDFVRRRD